MRKVSIITGILMMGVVIIWSMFNRTTDPSISLKINGDMSKVKIGRQMMENYLNNFTNKRSRLNSWLTEYQINEIKSEGFYLESENNFVITAVFSVKPYFKVGENFWDDTGVKEDDSGWIRNKKATMIINKDNNLYKLNNLITN